MDNAIITIYNNKIMSCSAEYPLKKKQEKRRKTKGLAEICFMMYIYKECRLLFFRHHRERMRTLAI